MSGFFGQILGGINSLEGIEGNQQGAHNLVSELLDQAGGVNGLMAQLGQSGLGDKVQTWTSGGTVSMVASDIEQVFPPEQLEALAEKHGIPAGIVSQLLAHALPQAVAQAAPDATPPADSQT